jgi:hypothetical protein
MKNEEEQRIGMAGGKSEEERQSSQRRGEREK